MAAVELPGRPRNLTEEQTVKLKEMWSVAFKVFGTPIESESANEVGTVTVADVPDGKDKKGGKLTSILWKKKESKESSSVSITDVQNDVSKLAIADAEDKYSQTKEFKELLLTSSPQEIHDAFWRMVKADHPDSLFLRFLRARKWDVSKAIVMLVATMRWRSKEVDVRSISTVLKKG